MVTQLLQCSARLVNLETGVMCMRENQCMRRCKRRFSAYRYPHLHPDSLPTM